jgi:hypothetical protein
MLSMEIIDFCSEIRLKHLNSPCRTQNLLISNLMVHTVTTVLQRFKHHIIKIYWGVEILVHRYAFLTLVLCKSGQLHTLVTLPLGGRPDTHSIEDQIDSRHGRKLWRGKPLMPLLRLGIRFTDRWGHSLVTMLTELFGLSYYSTRV